MLHPKNARLRDITQRAARRGSLNRTVNFPPCIIKRSAVDICVSVGHPVFSPVNRRPPADRARFRSVVHDRNPGRLLGATQFAVGGRFILSVITVQCAARAKMPRVSRFKSAGAQRNHGESTNSVLGAWRSIIKFTKCMLFECLHTHKFADLEYKYVTESVEWVRKRQMEDVQSTRMRTVDPNGTLRGTP